MLNSVQLAVDEINQAGGVNGRTIKLIAEDGKCDAKEAVTAANELLNVQGVKVVLTGCSSESLAVAPLANQKKALQLGILTSSKDYTNAGDYSFRTFPSTGKYVRMLGEQAGIKYNAKRIAVLVEQKDFPKSAAISFKEGFEKNGGSILAWEEFLPDETGFKTHIAKITQSNIDGIFFASQGQGAAIRWLKTMNEEGLIGKYKLFSNVSAVSKGVFEGSQGLNKNIVTTDLYVNESNPQTKAFLENYNKKYGDYPSTTLFWNASAYDGVYFIRNALRACGNESSECLKGFLYKNSIIGASGPMSFDEYGDAITQVGLHYYDEAGKEQWINLGTAK